MAVTTDPVDLRTVPTVPRTIATATTRPPALMRVVAQFQTVTAAPALARRTTQKQWSIRLHCANFPTMPYGSAGAIRRLRKTADHRRQPAYQTNANGENHGARCTARPVPLHMARRARTATAPLWAKAQMATSMRRQTAKPTAIRAAVGTRRAEARVRPVTTNPVPAAGAGRRRAVAHQQ